MIRHGNQKYTLILNKLRTPDRRTLQVNSAQVGRISRNFGEIKPAISRDIPPYPAISRHCKIIPERTVVSYQLDCGSAIADN